MTYFSAKNQRTLSDEEIKLLWEKVDQYKESGKVYDFGSGQEEYTIEEEISFIVSESLKKMMKKKSKIR